MIKKTTLIIFVLILISCISTITTAHAPTSVNLTYDKNGEILTVDVNHAIEEGDTTHYIETVEIRVNGELITQEDHTSQSINGGALYAYDINANDGDEIEVTAYCSTGESKTEKMTLGATSGEDDNSTPGFGLILLVSSIVGLILIKRKK